VATHLSVATFVQAVQYYGTENLLFQTKFGLIVVDSKGGDDMESIYKNIDEYLPEGEICGYVRRLRPDDFFVPEFNGGSPEEGDFGFFNTDGYLLLWNEDLVGTMDDAKEDGFLPFFVH